MTCRNCGVQMTYVGEDEWGEYYVCPECGITEVETTIHLN